MDKKVSKKLNPILKEANSYKNQKNYEEAVRKFREGISFIRLNIKDYEEREAEVNNLLEVIDKTYSEHIDVLKDNIEQLLKELKVTETNILLDELNSISSKINDNNLRDLEVKKIRFITSEIKIHELINQGIIANENQEFDKAIEILQNAMNKSEELFNNDPYNLVFTNIRNFLNKTYFGKIESIIVQGDELYKSNKAEEAIKVYKDALNLCLNLTDLNQKNEEILKIETSVNQIYSEMLKPILQKGKELLAAKNIDEGIDKLKKAENEVIMMFDSKEKSDILKELSELLNPIFKERIIPIKEEGLKFLEEENYEEKIKLVTEAAETFQRGLKIAEQMVISEEKSKSVNELSQLINDTCSAGINVRKDKSKLLIKEKKFEEAVSEMYSAMSIAKTMACSEEDNKQIEDIKSIVNQMYSDQINEILERGKKLLKQKKNEEAFEIFNEALGVSNKMYVSEEMDKQIRKINELLREAEIKKLVSDGNLMIEQKKFSKELEELQISLQDADKITDLERKTRKIREVKELIDQVHSKEIKFLNEQALLLAEKGQYDESYSHFDEALSIVQNIDKEKIRIQEKTEIIKLYTQELNNDAEKHLENHKFDKAIDLCNHALELDENFTKSHYNRGNAYLGKKEYQVAIKNYEKAVDLDPNYVNAWSDMGLTYELKNEFDAALKNLNKAIEINQSDSTAWYRLANVYKHMNNIEKSLESYKTATELNPENSKAWLFMASLYHEKKDYKITLEYMKKAANLDVSLNKKLGSTIQEFDKIIGTIQEKLSDLFKNKQDKF